MHRIVATVCCLAALSVPPLRGEELGLHRSPQLRQPVAIEVVAGEKQLLAANRRSGTLSRVDLARGQVVDEVRLGDEITDFVAVGDKSASALWLAVDRRAGELLVVATDGGSIGVRWRTKVAADPIRVAVSADGSQIYVSSLWSRQVCFLDWDREASTAPQLAKTLDLPFAPRELLPLADKNVLLVADAFGGKLAIVDTQTRQLTRVRELPAHNIRGITLSPDGRKVLVAHQILNSLAETTQNDVHWGILMTNVLRWLVVDRVLDPTSEILKDSHVHPPGDTRTAGGDPAMVRITDDSQAVLALAGVDELATGRESDFSLTRVRVGRMPTALALSADGETAWVANTLDDTVSEVDLETVTLRRTIALGPRPKLSQVDEGERLFFNARLSLDGWFSCHSCHTDGHTNGMVADNLGDGSFGAAKRVLSLLGTADTKPWAWNGSIKRIDDQVHKSVQSTMRGQPIDDAQASAIGAYMKTLKPPRPLAELRGTLDAAAVSRGKAVFAARNCQECHAPPYFTSPGVYDVGLSDKKGNQRFNPPSLRGVSQRGPFFHDGRAKALAEVFTKYGHQLDAPLSGKQLADLTAYLESL